jgi:hypothetical protein
MSSAAFPDFTANRAVFSSSVEKFPERSGSIVNSLYVSDVKLFVYRIRDFDQSKPWRLVVDVMQCHWLLFDV